MNLVSWKRSHLGLMFSFFALSITAVDKTVITRT